MFRPLLSGWIIISFLFTLIIPAQGVHADEYLGLPQAGTMVNLSPAYAPVLIKGLKVHPENPLLFDFIIDTGRSGYTSDNPQLRQESEKLIKYFLATLTVPENDLWVNLSPYEKSRIIPDQLGKTELGREMLAQDYILKQLTASLIYPEKGLGKEFWDRVYAKSERMFGTDQIPVNTFNKVWILPDKAGVFVRNNTAYVVDAHLKVMLEEDYLAMNKHRVIANSPHSIGSQIIRQIILPEIEKEVNEGKNFAPLRQVFYSLVLATWYKKNLKQALLNQVYSNKNKISGVENEDKNIKEKIYQQYLTAYKKGVFNYIKEDVDRLSQQPVPRKYFSGGEVWNKVSPAMYTDADLPVVRRGLSSNGTMMIVNAAMSATVATAMAGSPNEFYLKTDEQLIERYLLDALSKADLRGVRFLRYSFADKQRVISGTIGLTHVIDQMVLIKRILGLLRAHTHLDVVHFKVERQDGDTLHLGVTSVESPSLIRISSGPSAAMTTADLRKLPGNLLKRGRSFLRHLKASYSDINPTVLVTTQAKTPGILEYGEKDLIPISADVLISKSKIELIMAGGAKYEIRVDEETLSVYIGSHLQGTENKNGGVLKIKSRGIQGPRLQIQYTNEGILLANLDSRNRELYYPLIVAPGKLADITIGKWGQPTRAIRIRYVDKKTAAARVDELVLWAQDDGNMRYGLYEPGTTPGRIQGILQEKGIPVKIIYGPKSNTVTFLNDSHDGTDIVLTMLSQVVNLHNRIVSLPDHSAAQPQISAAMTAQQEIVQLMLNVIAPDNILTIGRSQKDGWDQVRALALSSKLTPDYNLQGGIIRTLIDTFNKRPKGEYKLGIVGNGKKWGAILQDGTAKNGFAGISRDLRLWLSQIEAMKAEVYEESKEASSGKLTIDKITWHIDKERVNWFVQETSGGYFLGIRITPGRKKILAKITNVKLPEEIFSLLHGENVYQLVRAKINRPNGIRFVKNDIVEHINNSSSAGSAAMTTTDLEQLIKEKRFSYVSADPWVYSDRNLGYYQYVTGESILNYVHTFRYAHIFNGFSGSPLTLEDVESQLAPKAVMHVITYSNGSKDLIFFPGYARRISLKHKDYPARIIEQLLDQIRYNLKNGTIYNGRYRILSSSSSYNENLMLALQEECKASGVEILKLDDWHSWFIPYSIDDDAFNKRSEEQLLGAIEAFVVKLGLDPTDSGHNITKRQSTLDPGEQGIFPVEEYPNGIKIDDVDMRSLPTHSKKYTVKFNGGQIQVYDYETGRIIDHDALSIPFVIFYDQSLDSIIIKYNGQSKRHHAYYSSASPAMITARPTITHNKSLNSRFIDGMGLTIIVDKKRYAMTVNKGKISILKNGKEHMTVKSGQNDLLPIGDHLAVRFVKGDLTVGIERGYLAEYSLDRATLVADHNNVQGGIDFNARNLNVSSSGDKIDIHFNKAMIAQFERGDFAGVQAQIMSIRPLSSVFPLFGLNEPKERFAFSG